MKLQIITPEKELFSGEVTSVSLPGVDGSLGVLNNHAPLITVLKAGEVVVKNEENGEEKTFEVTGGVVEVNKNVVLILAE